MNIVVFGPDPERRLVPPWTVKPVPENRLAPLEVLVQRVGQEIHGRVPVTILGRPWVRTGGISLTASLEEYLPGPIHLLRALTVAFIGREDHVTDGAVVVADASNNEKFSTVRDWVNSRLPPVVPKERIVWAILEADLRTLLESAVDDAEQHEGGDAPRHGVQRVALPADPGPLSTFCDSLAALFE